MDIVAVLPSAGACRSSKCAPVDIGAHSITERERERETAITKGKRKKEKKARPSAAVVGRENE